MSGESITIDRAALREMAERASVAAVTPAVVLALLDALDAAERDLSDAHALLTSARVADPQIEHPDAPLPFDDEDDAFTDGDSAARDAEIETLRARVEQLEDLGHAIKEWANGLMSYDELANLAISLMAPETAKYILYFLPALAAQAVMGIARAQTGPKEERIAISYGEPLPPIPEAIRDALLAGSQHD